jgi:hypothetical protein
MGIDQPLFDIQSSLEDIGRKTTNTINKINQDLLSISNIIKVKNTDIHWTTITNITFQGLKITNRDR